MLIIFEKENGDKLALPVMNAAFVQHGTESTMAYFNNNSFLLKGSLDHNLMIIKREVMAATQYQMQPQLQFK